MLVGGAVANVFLKAKGYELGASFVEDVFVDFRRREKKDWVLYAKEILEKYKNKVVCPEDLVIYDGISEKMTEEPEEYASYKLTDDVILAVAAVVEAKIDVFGSGGKI